MITLILEDHVRASPHGVVAHMVLAQLIFSLHSLPLAGLVFVPR